MSDKSCNCIDVIGAKVKEVHPDADLELVMQVSMTSNQLKAAIPPLYFKYHKRKPNGTLEKKVSRSFICFSHCPFCGRKLT